MYRRLFFLWLFLLAAQFSFAQIDDGEMIDDEVIDNTVIKNDKKDKKLKERKNFFKVDNIFIGTTFFFSFGPRSFYLDVSPYVGYLFGKYIGVGVGAAYVYRAVPISPNFVVSDHIYGGRLFANVRPFPDMRGLKGLYAHMEGEYLNHQVGIRSNGAPVRESVPAMNIGLGYNTSFSKGFAFTSEILINALWFSQVQQGILPVYNTFWQYRLGIYYAF